jgi:predicted ATPase
MAALGRQPALLVLDNFEHLLTEGALLVRDLLERVETLMVLVTSRQRLGLAGEREFVVHPLPIPSGTESLEDLTRCESVQIFTDRAQAVRPDFQVTERNAASVTELCVLLEGIPLALELAAARVGVLTPAQMFTRMERRFVFLVSRQSHAEARHRTLRAAIDWSYHLLSAELQRFFARLSVFQGGWTLEAAQAVCDEPLGLDYLEQLRECSLVLAEDVSGETRFRMRETLREYGRERLAAGGEGERIRRRHAEFFLALTEEAEPELKGPDQAAWLDRLEREHDNLSAALTWLVESGGAEQALRLGGALWWFWMVRGYLAEGRERLAAVLAMAGELRTAARAEVLAGVGGVAWAQGDHAGARSHLEESVGIRRQLGDEPGLAFAVDRLGNIALHQGDYEVARALFEESRALHRGKEAQWGVALALTNLGRTALKRGDTETAGSHFAESLALCRELGDQWGIGNAMSNFGLIALSLGDYVAARSFLEQGLAIRRQLGNKPDIAWSISHLGTVGARQGEYVAARSLLEEGLSLWRELGDRESVAVCLEALAAVAGGEGQPERAARLCGAAAALRKAIGVPRPPADQDDYDRRVAAARDTLGEEAFAAAWSAGQAMSIEDAIRYALDE